MFPALENGQLVGPPVELVKGARVEGDVDRVVRRPERHGVHAPLEYALYASRRDRLTRGYDPGEDDGPRGK